MTDAFENHIMESKDDGTYMGVFHLAAAATVIGKEVMCVYPVYGGFNVTDDLHRRFLPRTSRRTPSEAVGGSIMIVVTNKWFQSGTKRLVTESFCSIASKIQGK